MSLSRRIAAEVDDLVKSCAPPLCLHAEEGPHRIDVPVSLATPVGIECQGFDFTRTDRVEMSLEDLKTWGKSLAARLTYLMEPLSLLEADPVGGEVILRSQAPTPRNGRRSYYEVHLRKTGLLRFDRIAFDETTRERRKTPCQFTREVLERLTDDLVATSV